ncbi:unnamed protein product [Closterium sp. Yama58-4]|nr:unnamed protein product [Closterium sp. Yama58-4]
MEGENANPDSSDQAERPRVRGRVRRRRATKLLQLQSRGQQQLQSGGQQQLLQRGGQQQLQSGRQQELQSGGQRQLQRGDQQLLQSGGQQELQSREQQELRSGEQQQLQSGGQQELQSGGQEELQSGGQQDPLGELDVEIEAEAYTDELESSPMEGENANPDSSDQAERPRVRGRGRRRRATKLLQLQRGGQQQLQSGGQQELQGGGQQPNQSGGQQQLQCGGQQELQGGGQQPNQSGGQQQLQSGGQQQLQSGGQQQLQSGWQQQLQSGWQQQLQSGGQQPNQSGGQQQLQSGWQRQLQSGGQHELQGGGQQPNQSGGQQQLQRGGQQQLQSGGQQPNQSGGQQQLQSGGQQELQSGGQQQLQSGGQQPNQSGGQQQLQSGGQQPNQSGGQRQLQSGGQHELQGGGQQQLQSGGQQQLLQSGGQHELQGGGQQQLQSGGQQQLLQSGGQQELQSGGQQQLQSGGQQQLLQSGGQHELQSGGQHELQGGGQQQLQSGGQQQLQSGGQQQLQSGGQQQLQSGGQQQLQSGGQQELQSGGQQQLQSGGQQPNQSGGQQQLQSGGQQPNQSGGQQQLQSGGQQQLQSGGQHELQGGGQQPNQSGGQQQLQSGGQQQLQSGGQQPNQSGGQQQLQSGGQQQLQSGGQQQLQSGGQQPNQSGGQQQLQSGGQQRLQSGGQLQLQCGGQQQLQSGGQQQLQSGGQQQLQSGGQQQLQSGGQQELPDGVQLARLPEGEMEMESSRQVLPACSSGEEHPDPMLTPPPRIPCETCYRTFTERGKATRHMSACRAADAKRRAQALGLTRDVTDDSDSEPPPPRDISEEVWAAVPTWDWESFFGIELVPGRIMRRIPQRARLGVLDALACILKRLKSKAADEAASLVFLAFPRLFLGIPTGQGQGQRAAIRERLEKFWAGEWQQLFELAVAAMQPAARPLSFTPPEHDPDAVRLSRCRTRCKVGEWSRGLACLTAGSIAQPSQHMVDALRAKHPSCESAIPGWVQEETVEPSLIPQLSVEVLGQAIHSAARASAPGPSGWVTEHLRDTFLSEPAYLSHLLEVFTQWTKGEVAERVRPWLTASNLVGLSKPNGDVRPVAIGEVLPRILSRAICIVLRPKMMSHFAPCNQFGVGSRSGVEVLAHAFRSAISTHPSWCALQIDVANAFNSFHRREMFEGLRQSPFKGLIPFLRVFYGTPSDLYLRAGPFVEALASERGSRQGDPLGPFLFAFTQQLVMEPTKTEYADLLFLSYADDTYILGPRERVLAAYEALRERLDGLGLEVQPHKCKLWERGRDQDGEERNETVPPGMQQTWTGLTVVGVPIGEEDWEVASLRRRLTELHAPVPWLPLLDHPQIASHLLAIAVSARPIYLTRTMPPRPEVVEAFRDWDTKLEDCFEELFPDSTWDHDSGKSQMARLQLHLPARLGGFGIRSAADLSPLSYACGWCQAVSDVARLGVAGEERMFEEFFRTPEATTLLDPWFARAVDLLPQSVRQEMPPLALCTADPPMLLFPTQHRRLAVESLQSLRGMAHNDATLARLTSLQGPGAGAWVSAVPSHEEATFTAAEWSICASMRLGLPIQQLIVAGKCACGFEFADPSDPHHALRCKYQYAPSRVHDAVKFVVAKIAKGAGGIVTMEDDTLLPGKRVDVAVRKLREGEEHALEVSVVDPISLSAQHHGQIGRKVGFAAREREKRKTADYKSLLQRHGGVQFTPLIAETWGCLGGSFGRWLKKQGDAQIEIAKTKGAARATGKGFSAYLLGSLKAAVGVALQRAQARVILLRAASMMRGPEAVWVEREDVEEEMGWDAPWADAPYLVDMRV